MKGLKQFNLLIFLVVLASPFLLFADEWTQTDWSGGDGYYQWQEPTGYYEGSGVNGWRSGGDLLLYAPDFEHFVSIGKMPGTMGVYSLYTDVNHYYAGTDDSSGMGNAGVWISTNFGGTWNCSVIDSGFISKVTSIYLPSFDNELFAGVSPSKIYRSICMGDSGWDSKGFLSGTYASALLETKDNYLYASTVREPPVNHWCSVWHGELGSGWTPLGRQPNINDILPAAIYQFILTEDLLNDYDFFISTYYTNYGARIFRFSVVTQEWELCPNLPDTSGIPFAMHIGNDTLGNFGIIYVGIGDAYGKVFRSADFGDTWDSSGSLAAAWSVNGIRVDVDGTVYAACLVYGKGSRGFEVRIFRSTDMGLTWESTASLGSVLTNKPTSFYQTKRGFLLVGTAMEGEIFKAAYKDSGYLESSVYDVGTGNGSSEFGVIQWQESLNNQILRVKVRTDADSLMNNAVPWHLCLAATNGQNLSDLPSVWNGHRYIQYRAEFETDSIDYSSVLRKITIDYTIDSTAPQIDTAFASDGDTLYPGIDVDDYVMIVFDDSTNEPPINPDSINSILALNNGHSWLDGHGFVYAEWLSAESLKISWPGLVGSPTVAVGDTIYPDTSTIADRWGNGSYAPAVLTGSFGPPGIGEGELTVPHSDKILIFPSVTRRYLTACLNLDEDSNVNIALFDVSGRFVQTLLEKQFTKGRYSFGISTQNQHAGIYFIKTQINNASFIEKIVIVK